jgi:hypothetical protein
VCVCARARVCVCVYYLGPVSRKEAESLEEREVVDKTEWAGVLVLECVEGGGRGGGAGGGRSGKLQRPSLRDLP